MAPRARSNPGRCHADRGQALPLALGLLALAVVLLLAAVPLARGALEASSAQTAADAVALAGAAEGPAAARAVAAANDAEVLDYGTLGSDVWVVVRKGGAVARARARVETGVSLQPTG